MAKVSLKPKSLDGVEVFCPMRQMEVFVNLLCRTADGQKCGYYKGSEHDYVNNRIVLDCDHPDIEACNPYSEIDL